jgi:hypothetical protein
MPAFRWSTLNSSRSERPSRTCRRDLGVGLRPFAADTAHVRAERGPAAVVDTVDRRAARRPCPHCEVRELALPASLRRMRLPGGVEVRSFAAEACGESQGHARRLGEPVRADGNDATRTPAAPPAPERLSAATVHATSVPASRVRMQLAGSAMDGFRRDGSAMADTRHSNAERGARGGASRTNEHAGHLRLSGRGVRRSCRDPEPRQTTGAAHSRSTSMTTAWPSCVADSIRRWEPYSSARSRRRAKRCTDGAVRRMQRRRPPPRAWNPPRSSSGGRTRSA